MKLTTKVLDAETLSVANSSLIENGFCVVPEILRTEVVNHVLERLWLAAHENEKQGAELFIPDLDPNSSNVRIFYLLQRDAIFRELIQHPAALQVAKLVLGPKLLVSNFTANVARPGSGSMVLHSDQSLVVPDPWEHPWAVNIVWCLSDVYFENGATLYIPGSHKWQRKSEVPANATEMLKPFTAKAGSIIAMDARVWHTSGANITESVERALLFGYYTKPFLRQQVNWTAALSQEIKDSLDPDMHELLGLNITANSGSASDVGLGLEKYEAKGVV